MNEVKKAISVLVWLAVALLLGWKAMNLGDSSLSSYPNQPIQVIVPYGAGGGTDTFARVIQKSISKREVLPQPLVIINQPGGGGTIGSRFVMGSRPDGYRILCQTEAMITSQVSGTVSFGHEDFIPIAQTGSVSLLVLVREDSPHDDLVSLLKEAKDRPNEVRFGADVGSLAYFTGMTMEELSPGSRFNYVSTRGAQKRFAQMLGGHLDAGIFTLSEYRSYRAPEETPPDQNIKAIALLKAERNAAIPDVATAIEQGLDIDTGNAYYWWAPKGTPSGIVDTLASVFEETMQDDAVRDALDKQSIGFDFRKGEEVNAYLDKRYGQLSAFGEVATPSGLPNFPLWVAVIVLALFVWMRLESRSSSETGADDGTEPSFGDTKIAVVVSLILLGYMLALQFGAVYSLATLCALFLISAHLSEWQKSRFLPIAQMTLLFTLGTEYVFTVVFSVPLP